MSSRLVAMARRASPVGLAHRAKKEKDKKDERTLAEKIYAAQGYPKFGENEEVIRLFSKLAVSMTGVTNIMKGRTAGAAGVSMAKVSGKALSTQAINPNRSVRSAMTSLSPKSS